ncbi:MAG TPA: ABC transporter permease [Candidatus Mediterraneibacter intestinigallinarum]|nr:ABC transporter permease [Candidatus Mediterraneibacter intestinigallinarum]
MWNLIKYSFLTKIRNRSIVFWPLIFPFILTTVMYFSIGQMEESDFETVNVAVVAENAGGSEAEEAFLTWLEMMEESSDMIHIEQMEEDEALDRLEKGQIDGIFYNGETPALTVGRNGLPESILQIVLENYIEGRKTLEDVAAVSPEKLKDAVFAMEDYTDSVEQVTLGGKTTNGNVQFFYALLGMACLYGCFIGYGSAMELQAYLTPLAARRCAGPSNRLHVILSETLVSFVLHFVNMMILLAYMKYVLRLEFSGSYAEMLPALFLGSMIGVTMGMFITSIGKMGEGMKVGVMVGVSMAMSFCAGLMNADIKNIIDRSAPLLNRINPAALISDALYCINVYDAPARYAQDILILGVMCVLLTGGTYLIIRRERYGSI